jgi:protein translocase SEC61 complex gamma subunit
VWRLLRKPSREEFLTISKVSAIGLLIIGAIGFVIAMAMGMFSIF